MVNTNFYLTINELVTRASAGTITNVVDYDSFIDAGKKLADITNTDIMNEFSKQLMNKVQLTIMDQPSYRGALVDMYRGRLDYGVLEIIMGDFYEANASVFDGDGTLEDGQVYTDQFRVNLPPEGAVRYYTDYDSYMVDVTIRDTDLRGAWTSPSQMDAFIRMQFLNVANSNEFHKELARLGVVAGIIRDISAASGAENTTDENIPALNYNLLAIYNEEFGTTLTSDDCLANDDFVSWSVGVIRDISKLMEKPSKQFSLLKEVTTFTIPEDRKLIINSIYDKAIRKSLIAAYNPEYGMIDFDYEVIPYWQNVASRLQVTTNTEEESETTYSNKVLAVMYDKRACGEMINLEAVDTTRNARRRYTNYHYMFSNMYWINKNANTVIFTIGDA